MKFPHKPLTTPEAYLTFAQEFITLVDKEFIKWEEMLANGEDLGNIAGRLPALVSLVNTVGYLRGQDGVFDPAKRPYSREMQRELYAYEDHFEERFDKLIEAVLSSAEEKEYYRAKLHRYYCVVRMKEIEKYPTI